MASADHAGGPLLIALCGEVGSGKTTLAGSIAAETSRQGRVAGFLQPAGPRGEPGRGAHAYAWLALEADASPIDFLQRDDAASTAYRMQADAVAAIDAWQARCLADRRPVDLLVLDEIGGLELSGAGHRARIAALLSMNPSAVMVVAQRRHLEGVSALLGQPFDVVVDAADPGAQARLREVLVARRDYERVGWFGALAGGIEVGAGSVVHGAKLPFGGLGMATTQAALLTRAAEPLVDRGRVVWVALLSAAIKSLSPAGQRLRPMLAIAMQGWLYGRALRWLGWHRFAVGVGGFLMGCWAGSQGLLMQWLLVGDALWLVVEKVSGEAALLLGLQSPPIAPLVAAWIAAHGAVVAAGTFVAWRRAPLAPGEIRLPAWFAAPRLSGARGWRQQLAHAFGELRRPAFWLPLLLILGGLAWAGQPGETLLWVCLRALLIAWVLFVVVQRLDLAAVPGRLRTLGHWGPAIAWRRAMASLQARAGDSS